MTAPAAALSRHLHRLIWRAARAADLPPSRARVTFRRGRWWVEMPNGLGLGWPRHLALAWLADGAWCWMLNDGSSNACADCEYLPSRGPHIELIPYLWRNHPCQSPHPASPAAAFSAPPALLLPAIAWGGAKTS